MAGKKTSKKIIARAARRSPGLSERFHDLGVEMGIDPRAMKQLVTRLEGRPVSVRGRLKLDDVELLSLIDEKLANAFFYLDDFALGQSSARDLSVTIGVLTDKRRLLKPENDDRYRPQEDMKALDAMLKMLHAEAVRRGMTDDFKAPLAAPAENPGNGSAP